MSKQRSSSSRASQRGSLQFTTLKTKILALLTAALMLFGFIALISNILLSNKIDNFKHLIEVDNVAGLEIGNLNLQFKTQVQEWKNVLLRGHNVEDREKYWGKFVEQHEKVQKQAQAVVALPISAELISKVKEFRQIHAALLSQYKKGLDAFQANSFDHKLGDATVRGIDRAPGKALEELVEQVQAQISKKNQTLQAQSANLQWLTILAIVLALVMSIVVSNLYMNRSIVKPILKLIEQLRGLSNGDFTTTYNVHRSDEIGEMSNAIQLLGNKLKNVCEQLIQIQGKLVTLSEGLSHGSTTKRKNNGCVSCHGTNDTAIITSCWRHCKGH